MMKSETEPMEQDQKINGKVGAYPVICAWCNKVLGEKEGMIGPSHTICPECKKNIVDPQLEQLRKEKEK